MFKRLYQAWKRFQNARLYRRLGTEIPVRVTTEKGDSLDLTITNWSPGGVFLRTDKPFPMYSRTDLEFSLGTSGGSRLKLKGQVVRHETTGVGIMFTDFTESALLILRDFLAKESTQITSNS